MSCSFEIDDQVVWRPETGEGRLFVLSADSIAGVLDTPHGLTRWAGDYYIVDRPGYAAFVGKVSQEFVDGDSAGHELVRHFVAASTVLLRAALTIQGGAPSIASVDLGEGRA